MAKYGMQRVEALPFVPVSAQCQLFMSSGSQHWVVCIGKITHDVQQKPATCMTFLNSLSQLLAAAARNCHPESASNCWLADWLWLSVPRRPALAARPKSLQADCRRVCPKECDCRVVEPSQRSAAFTQGGNGLAPMLLAVFFSAAGSVQLWRACEWKLLEVRYFGTTAREQECAVSLDCRP